jgi:hypothetical protein
LRRRTQVHCHPGASTHASGLALPIARHATRPSILMSQQPVQVNGDICGARGHTQGRTRESRRRRRRRRRSDISTLVRQEDAHIHARARAHKHANCLEHVDTLAIQTHAIQTRAIQTRTIQTRAIQTRAIQTRPSAQAQLSKAAQRGRSTFDLFDSLKCQIRVDRSSYCLP